MCCALLAPRSQNPKAETLCCCHAPPHLARCCHHSSAFTLISAVLQDVKHHRMKPLQQFLPLAKVPVKFPPHTHSRAVFPGTLQINFLSNQSFFLGVGKRNFIIQKANFLFQEVLSPQECEVHFTPAVTTASHCFPATQATVSGLLVLFHGLDWSAKLTNHRGPLIP